MKLPENDPAEGQSELNAGLAVATKKQDDDKEFLTFDEAVARLPISEMVHTFRQSGFVLLGADWEKEELINALCKAKVIEVTGAQAQAMNHGMAIKDENGWLFIETANADIKQRR